MTLTTDATWRLALTRERWRELRGEPNDAQLAARNVFDQFCRSADWLMADGFIRERELPTYLRRNR